MVRTIVFTILTLVTNFSFSQEIKNAQCDFKPFKVFLIDKDEFSNIRESPNGRIVIKISNDYFQWGYILNVIDFKGGWFKVNNMQGLDEYYTSSFKGWVHKSIIGTLLTHDTYLLDKPNGKKTILLKGETGGPFKFLDAYCEWVKIETESGVGWIKSEKLCGNPVTTCP